MGQKNSKRKSPRPVTEGYSIPPAPANAVVARKYNGTAELTNASIDTPLFTMEGKILVAKCVKVYDGDTVHIVTKLRDDEDPVRFKCRMYGYNSAEMRTADPVERARAIAARNALQTLILDKIILVTCYKFDKYGRLLIDCTLSDYRTGVRAWMIEHGHGAEYYGRGEKKY